MKKIVKLNESELHGLILESVRRLLNEHDPYEGPSRSDYLDWYTDTYSTTVALDNITFDENDSDRDCEIYDYVVKCLQPILDENNEIYVYCIVDDDKVIESNLDEVFNEVNKYIKDENLANIINDYIYKRAESEGISGKD